MTKTVVVGGGLVGLATAWSLAQRGHDIMVFEKELAWAAHQSGHNSGVVHSGLYYAPGSLKATMAVAAATSLEHFCAEHGIVADIELIRGDQINEAWERMIKGDVKYRFVIDSASLATT